MVMRVMINPKYLMIHHNYNIPKYDMNIINWDYSTIYQHTNPYINYWDYWDCSTIYNIMVPSLGLFYHIYLKYYHD